jgi:hypothetical protein
MAYMKKDEDADQAMIKLDRTTVFQEGKTGRLLPAPTDLSCWLDIDNIDHSYSKIVQFITNLSAKMPYPPHKARRPPIHRREIPLR